MRTLMIPFNCLRGDSQQNDSHGWKIWDAHDAYEYSTHLWSKSYSINVSTTLNERKLTVSPKDALCIVFSILACDSLMSDQRRRRSEGSEFRMPASVLIRVWSSLRRQEICARWMREIVGMSAPSFKDFLVPQCSPERCLPLAKATLGNQFLWR